MSARPLTPSEELRIEREKMAKPYQAFTAYDVEIQKPLHDRKSAMEWARFHGPKFTGSYIVQNTARGRRVIWREEKQREAA